MVGRFSRARFMSAAVAVTGMFGVVAPRKLTRKSPPRKDPPFTVSTVSTWTRYRGGEGAEREQQVGAYG
jgi:hypothetical protein